MPSLTQLRCLLFAVRYRTIGAAARRLGMSQSGISQAIAGLEKALGVSLLARDRDGVTPTAFALDILADAEMALDAVERIRNRISAKIPSVRPLRVAAIRSAAITLLPRAAREFRRLYPGFGPDILVGSHVEVAEWVEEGIADLGFTCLPPKTLDAEPIREEELALVARRGHEALRQVPVRPEVIATEPVVTAAGGCRSLLETAYGDLGLPAPRVLNADDLATALDMVRAGIAVALLPPHALEQSSMLDLRIARLDRPVYRRLYAVCPPGGGGVGVGEFLRQIRLAA